MIDDGRVEAILQGEDPWLMHWERLPSDDRRRLERMTRRGHDADDPAEALLAAGLARSRRRSLRWQGLLLPCIVSVGSVVRLITHAGESWDVWRLLDIGLVAAAVVIAVVVVRQRAALLQAGDLNERRYRAQGARPASPEG